MTTDQHVPSAAEIDALLAPLPPLYAYVGNGQWRCQLPQYTREQMSLWVNREIARCADSLSYFLGHYCGTIEVGDDQLASLGGTIMLIPTQWPHVAALIRALSPPRDVLIEKSRQMLASWIAMGAVLHDLLFRPNWAVMTMSRIEKLVDDGGEKSTWASLHGKVRFLWDHLPDFLRARPLEFKHLSIRNASTNAYVAGFSSTVSAGRAPSFSRAIFDEFAHVAFSEHVTASADRSCPVGKALISTPYGKANAFARLRFHASRQIYPSPAEQQGDGDAVASPTHADESGRHWERYTIHWSQHPHRDRAWYDRIVDSKTLTAEAIAQELDISYERSVVGRVYPKFVYDLHVAGGALAPSSAPLSFDGARPLYLCCDFNVDPLVWLLVQPYNTPPLWRVIGEVCRRNATLEDGWREVGFRYGRADKVYALLAQHPDWEEQYGANGMLLAGPEGYRGPVEIYGDATEEHRTLYSRVKGYAMIVEGLRGFGFQVKLMVPPQNPPVRVRHETMNDALSKNLLLADPSCEQLIKDWESGIWDAGGRDMNQSTLDDDASGLTRSHASAALGYLLCRKHHIGTAAKAAKGARPSMQQDVAALLDRW